MKKLQRIYVVSVMILVFIGPFFGFIQPIITKSPVITSLAQTGVHARYDATDNTSLAALSNTVQKENIFINPGSNIGSVTVSKLRLVGYNSCVYVVKQLPYLVEFSIIDSILHTATEGFNIQGSPTITGENVSISGPLMSNSYPTPIDSPILKLNNVNASQIQLEVSGGTFSWNHSTTSAVYLNGFTTALLDSDNISKGLWVGDTGIVTIFNCVINATHETVAPTIPPLHSYTPAFAFVFQPHVQVNLIFGGLDNIRGPAYALNYTLIIYEGATYQRTITNIFTDTYLLTIDTAASYTIHVTCKDKQGNISNDAIITILPQASLLWLILMIVIIVAAAVATIAIFFWRKQRQWQKTSLVEIPA
jgi:hypothetical protein